MSDSEGIVWALTSDRETRYTPVLPESTKEFSASGQQFMSVSLVPYIPYYLVFRAVENSM